MQKGKVAVIGNMDVVSIFKAIGMDVFFADNIDIAEKTIKDIAKEYAIIYLTEDLAKKLETFLKRYENRPYPIIVPIPSAKGRTGYGIEKIKNNVEKAVGINILEE